MKKIINLLITLILVSNIATAESKLLASVIYKDNNEIVGDVKLSLLKNGKEVELKEITSVSRPIAFILDDQDAQYELKSEKDGYATEIVSISKKSYGEELPSTINITISLGKDNNPIVFSGKILDRESKKPVKNTKIKLSNSMTNEVFLTDTNSKGEYSLEIKKGYEYDLLYGDKDFLKRHANIKYCKSKLDKNREFCFFGFTNVAKDKKGGITADTLMDKIEIGKTFKIENIYYDFDSDKIRPDSSTQLKKLAYIMSDNPQITVELGSHADARGSDKYNLLLSQRRAQSAVTFVINQDTDMRRIVAKGYGETELKNECKNDINCSDTKHEVNRRTEFKIIDIDEKLLFDTGKENKAKS